jgi:hypothetical protein
MSQVPKKNDDEHALSDVARTWIDIQLRTTHTVKTMFEDRAIFCLFAGAVFALHQDVLQAYGIDMRRTDDRFAALVADKTNRHPLGSFGNRVSLVIDALENIIRLNRKLLDEGKPANIDEKEYDTHALLALMRETAAFVWTLSIVSKLPDRRGMQLSVVNVWLLLGMVASTEVLPAARGFTGTYFANICSETMDGRMWPYDPLSVA